MNENYLALREVNKKMANVGTALATFPIKLAFMSFFMPTAYRKKVLLPGENPPNIYPLTALIQYMALGGTLIKLSESSSIYDHPESLAYCATGIFGNVSSGFYEWFRHEKNKIRNESKKLENISEEQRMITSLRNEGYSNEIISETLKDSIYDLNQSEIEKILA